MEVLVTDSIGLPSDAVISVRFGTTRRQAPLESVAAHPLKFPSSLDSICEPIKIDILQPIATTRLVLLPHAEQYQIGFEQSEDMELGLSIAPSTGADRKDASTRPGSAMPGKFQDAATSAKDYLEEHGLLRYVQSMLHACIQRKPKDPFAFMVEQLSAAPSKTKTVRSRPSSALPGRMSLSQPTSAAPAGQVPVPPSSSSPSAMGERAQPPVGGDRLSNEDGSQVFLNRPLDQPASPQLEPTLKSQEVPELSNGEPQVSSEQPVEKAKPTQEETLKPHEVPEPPNERDARVLCEQPLDKPEPPQLETLRPSQVPRPHESPPPLHPDAEEERPLSSPSPTSPQLEATASPRAVSIAPAARPDAMEQPASDVEILRLRMRGLLGDAHGSGKLSQAVDAALASGLKSQSDDVLDELKLKMRKLIEDTANSGQLEEAIKNVVSENYSTIEKPIKASEASQADGETEAIKAKLCDLCTTAAESGKLQEVIDRISNQEASPKSASAPPPTADVELDEVKAKQETGGVLLQAPESGSLGMEQMCKKSQDVDFLKSRLRGMLAEACVSGRLGDVFSTVMAPKVQEQVRPQTKASPEVAADNARLGHPDAAQWSATKARLRSLMREASESGKLSKTVGKIVQKQATLDNVKDEAASETGLDDIKIKLRQLMKEAQVSGKLTQALGNIIATSQRTVDESQAEMREGQELPAAGPDDHEMAMIKDKLRSLLTEATESGQLVQALARFSDVVASVADAAPQLHVNELEEPAGRLSAAESLPDI